MDQPVVHVIGRGDHACVVIDALDATHRIVHVVAADVAAEDEIVETDFMEWSPEGLVLVNGIGFTGGANRRQIAHERLVERGFEIISVRHPSAVVSRSAHVSGAAQVMARTSLGPESKLCEGALLNTGAILEHHATVGSHSHIGPGAVLCGRVSVGSGTFIGAGSTVIPGIQIGSGAIVGAGSTVISDVPDGVVVVGSPATPLR